MNTKTLLLAAATAGLFTVNVQAAEEPKPNSNPPCCPCPPPGPGHRNPEMKIWHQKALEKYDLNKNGCLDPEERATIKADVDAGEFEAPPMRQRNPRGKKPNGRRQGPPPPPAE